MRTPPRGSYKDGEPNSIIKLPSNDPFAIREMTFGLEYSKSLETFSLVSIRCLNSKDELVIIISDPVRQEH